MVDAISTGAADSRTQAGGKMLASNFETFLSLLTAQLRNQDPLSPVDSNQFTAQLTQMAGVEQQLLTNDLLTALLAAQQDGGLAGASNYIGKEITAAWSANKLVDGQATWSYELATDASDVTLQVLDGSGKVVWSGPAPEKTTGVHDFTWDGATTGGGQMDNGGVYTLKVVAKNASGASVDAQVLTRGRVTGVEMYDGQPFLTVGNSIVPLSYVIAMAEQKTAEPPPPPPPGNDNEEEDPSLMARVASALNPFD
jgi:flagellar basal-body rod modification protein FlgD